jgi:hypothetical protein
MCWPVKADASDPHRGDLDWRELCRVQARESAVAPLTLILAMAAAAGKPRKIPTGVGLRVRLSAGRRDVRRADTTDHRTGPQPSESGRVAVRRAIGHIEASARQRRRLVVRGPHAELAALRPTPHPTAG